MAIKAVFFDLDGTLLDTAFDLAFALNSLLEEEGKAAIPNNIIRDAVSNGANALLELGFGVTPNHADFDLLRERLLAIYLNNLHTHTLPFAGIEKLIEQIHSNHMLWGIVTNKPWTYTEPLMQEFQFAQSPVAIVCPDHVAEKKPAPEGLILACKKADCDVKEAIYIGDHERDIECGRRAGTTTIAVGYGYIPLGDDPKNWGADHYAHTGDELWPIIKKVNSSLCQ